MLLTYALNYNLKKVDSLYLHGSHAVFLNEK